MTTHKHPLALEPQMHLIGESEVFRALLTRVRQLASLNVSVLITGEAGVGKDLVARVLHDGSGRSGRFVVFNVAELCESTFESQMFGHVDGAFTGAKGARVGLLTEAHLGTAFFDEIGALSFEMQPKLLRVVEQKRFHPVGASRDVASDFRVIAATNEDLSQKIRAGTFRKDLRDRLQAAIIRMPALRERPSDIPLLTRHYLEYAEGYQPGVTVLAPNALAIFEGYSWPGNIREVRSVMQQLVVEANGGPITARHAEAVFAHLEEVVETATPMLDRDAFLRRRLLEMLTEVGWDFTQAAERLSVNLSTIYRRMERLGIARKRKDSIIRDFSHVSQSPVRKNAKICESELGDDRLSIDRAEA